VDNNKYGFQLLTHRWMVRKMDRQMDRTSIHTCAIRSKTHQCYHNKCIWSHSYSQSQMINTYLQQQQCSCGNSIPLIKVYRFIDNQNDKLTFILEYDPLSGLLNISST